MLETLIILPREYSVAAAEALASVRQRFGDRVLIVSSDDEHRFRAIPGVSLIASGDQVMDLPPGLSETEELGIATWNIRREVANKSRPGDGLRWDATGFEAP